MFLGYKKDLISLVGNTKEELENIPCMTFTKIEETDEPVEMIGGVYYIGEKNIQEAKETQVRNYRNGLLQTEIDPIVTNPLRWSDLSEYAQNQYKTYREYLLDYTENENWWESNPKTFKEFFESENI